MPAPTTIDYEVIPADLDRPKRKADWVGRLVRLRRPVETNGGRIFPKGEVLLVGKSYGGLGLAKTWICPCCKMGEHFGVDKVPEHDVDLLPVGTPKPEARADYPLLRGQNTP